MHGAELLSWYMRVLCAAVGERDSEQCERDKTGAPHGALRQFDGRAASHAENML
jgi:hypothetical protein